MIVTEASTTDVEVARERHLLQQPERHLDHDLDRNLRIGMVELFAAIVDSGDGFPQSPPLTEEVFQDGWYHTGDAGYLDEGGYLFLVDRVKDMIVTGGENVYSAEVESAISKHEAVEQVAVIGIPHETWGEQVHAIVVLSAGAEASEEDIIAVAREHIAGYKLPKSVEFRSEPLPLSGAMKVLKKDLRAPYWEGHGRGVN